LDIYLPPLKPRQIDPLFLDDAGNVQRLSQIDSNFESLMAQQRALVSQAYMASIHINAETKALVAARVTENQATWLSALDRRRMKPEVMRELLRNSVAVAAVNRMIEIEGL
jgi:hypothetical protein